MRSPTLADAKKRGDLLPRVSTILALLDKPALNDWKLEQGVLAVMTTPRIPGEADDAFVHRVLHVERVQDDESRTARDRGTDIHAALEARMTGQPFDSAWAPWIEPAARAIESRGQYVASEKILIGDGYAGRTDLIQESPDGFLITDYKTSKTMPDPKKGAYIEHRLQLSSYAAAFKRMLGQGDEPRKPIHTANVYVSTIVQGAFLICDHSDWHVTYERGFRPLVQYWQWLTGYSPQQ
jgi:hypothetical protein